MKKVLLMLALVASVAFGTMKASATLIPSPATASAVVTPMAKGWEWRGGGSLRGISFADANHGWIAGDVGLLHTTDGGSTWKSVIGMGQYQLNDVQFTDAQRGWAVGQSGVILSTKDSGVTWLRQRSGATLSLTDVHFVDNAWGWVNGERPIRTTDGGVTWTLVVRPSEEPQDWYGKVQFLDRYIGWLTTRSALYRTNDGGLTWTFVSSLQDAAQPFFVDTLNGWYWGGYSYIGMFGYVLRTTDGGKTWNGSIVPANLEDLYFITPLVGWATSDGGVLKTIDGGITWTGQGAAGASRIEFRNEKEGWAVGDGGVIWSTIDGGATWQGYDSVTAASSVEALQAVDGSTVYAVGVNSVRADYRMTRQDSFFMRSTASGGWQSFGFSSGYQTALRALDFIDTQRGWIASGDYSADPYSCPTYWGGSVHQTENGGTSWNQVGWAPGIPRDLDMVDGKNGWVAYGSENCYYFGDYECECSTRGGIYHTSDGENWSDQLTLPGVMYAVDMIDLHQGYAVGDVGPLYRTVDGGAHWLRQPTAAGSLNDIFMLNATTGWTVGPGGAILRTIDGITWTAQPTSTRVNLRSVRFLDSLRGWVAGSGGVVLQTTDGGLHWSAMNTGIQLDLNTIDAISENNAWAGGASGIILRYNGAAQGQMTALQATPYQPAIDGKAETWYGLNETLLNGDFANSSTGSQINPSYGDLSIGLRSAWTSDRLYFAAAITDDVLVGNNSAQIWGDDAIELTVRTANMTHQFTAGVDGRQAEAGNPITSLTVATSTIPGGWSVEVSIPAHALGLTQLKAGQSYPFTFGLWDDDEATYPGQTHMIWQGASTSLYTADWGLLNLSGAEYDFGPQPALTFTPTPTRTATLTATATPTATASPTTMPPTTVSTLRRIFLPLMLN